MKHSTKPRSGTDALIKNTKILHEWKTDRSKKMSTLKKKDLENVWVAEKDKTNW